MARTPVHGIVYLWEWFYYEGREGARFTIEDIMTWLGKRKYHRESLTRKTCHRMLPTIFKDWIKWVDTGTYEIRRLPPVPRNIVNRVEKENNKLRKRNEYLEKQNIVLEQRLDEQESGHAQDKTYQDGRNDVMLRFIEALCPHTPKGCQQ